MSGEGDEAEERRVYYAPRPPSPEEEPRAREVVEASPGEVPGHDPSLRWERPLGAPAEAPTSLRPLAQMVPRALDSDGAEGLRPIDLTRTEYSLSPEIQSALDENSPQWFLRDLDRPNECPQVMLEFREGTDPRAAWDEALRTAADARVLPERQHVTSLAELLAEEKLRRAAFFAEPWEPALPDDAPRRRVQLYGEE